MKILFYCVSGAHEEVHGPGQGCRCPSQEITISLAGVSCELKSVIS
jgi:hypothetical protein